MAVAALTVSLGVGYALLVLGWRSVDPRNLSWITADPAQAYIGWEAFREATHLTFPLGWSNAIGYPFGMPIAYFDSIPLLATMFWIVKGILPANFQYLGMYFALCGALQFYFGYRISRRLFGGDRVAGLLGGVFFLTAPCFTYRGFGHFALSSHWLILAAIDQLLRAAARPSWRTVVWNTFLCFVAGGVNPYIAAMTFLVMCGAYLRPLLLRHRCAGRSATGIAAALVAMACAFLLFGFLRTTDFSQYSGGGYGIYSMNLLALFDPGMSPSAGGSASIVFPSLPRTPEQIEGFNYLGLGMMLLAIGSMCRYPSGLSRVFRRSAVPAVAIVVISLLLALSDKAAIGHAVIYQLNLPRPIMAALTSFRASGRLFWPGFYLIFVAILTLSSYAFRGRSLRVVLAAAVIVQCVDLSPLRAAIHQQWQIVDGPTAPPGPAWSDLGAQKHLIVLPPWQCENDETPGGSDVGYTIFGQLALQQHMTLNSFYAGRYSAAQTKFFCETQESQVEQDGLQADTAYVFSTNDPGWVAGLKYGQDYCRYTAHYVLCSRVPGQRGIDPAVVRDVPLLHDGSAVSFGGANPMARKMLGPGWSFPESWGRWMMGHTTAMTFRVLQAAGQDLQLNLTVMPLVRPDHPVQHVDVTVNGTLVKQAEITHAGESILSLVIPSHLIGDDGLVRLDFHCPDAVSPESLGGSDDTRILSIGLLQLDAGPISH